MDFDFLQEIAIAIQTDDDGLSLEMVEAVIIELNKRGCLCIVPPNSKLSSGGPADNRQQTEQAARRLLK